MTDFYANYISKTTFDPETHSVRSKMEEAATDMKKKPASKTPKLEVEPTVIPEKKHIEKEELHGDQHKLDHNKDMKIDAADMKMVRKKGAVKNHPAEDTTDEAMVIRSKKSSAKLRRDAESRPMGVREDDEELEEATFRVSISGLPTMHVSGSSAGEIKTSLRKMLKDPKALGNIEKITPSEKKSDLRAKMSEDQTVADYLKKGGKITKLPAGKAQGAHGDSKMASGIAGQLSTADTSRFKTKKKVKSMEDVEQVAELDKKTMGSYIKKATHDVDNRSFTQGMRSNNKDYTSADASNNRNIRNRRAGIARAANKMSEKFANPAQQAAAMAAIKAKPGYYKKPKEESYSHAGTSFSMKAMSKMKPQEKEKPKKESVNVEEKDTHVTKDGRTVKKGLWYYMNKRKKAGTSRPASAGTVSPEAMRKSQSDN
jgi:hypothetical protein|tara:strand:- start:14022 stop:15305 length:1284 start_codon:yes stop_codon:yes gene_type:complete